MEKADSMWQALTRGDTEAAAQLVELFYKPIFNYLGRLTGSLPDAEDLTQETFVKLWRSVDSFQQRCRISTWLYKLAYHVYLDWCKTRKKAVHQESQWWQKVKDPSMGPEQHLDRRLQNQDLYQRVEQLSEVRRHIIHLHYYQGVTLRQCAAVLEMPYGTVKYHLRHALRQLRTELRRDLRGSSPSLLHKKV